MLDRYGDGGNREHQGLASPYGSDALGAYSGPGGSSPGFGLTELEMAALMSEATNYGPGFNTIRYGDPGYTANRNIAGAHKWGGGGAGGSSSSTSTASSGGGGADLIAKEGFEGGAGAFTKGAAGGAKTYGGLTANQWVNTAGGALSSYMSAAEQAKVAREAAKSKPYERYRTPYGNEYISKLVSYILKSQQQVYANRIKGYGLQPIEFSSYESALAGVPKNYSGVGAP